MNINSKKLFWGILFLGLINSLFFMYGHKIVVDSLQLLERGYLLTQGYLVPFGPRSTHTNMIYGPFISLASGLGIFLTKNAVGILLVILFFHLLSFFLISRIEFLKFSSSFYFTYLFLFWVSPWRASEIFIWNVSFLFFTASLFLYSIHLLKKENYFWGTVVHGISYILSFQIHNSLLLFVPITLFLWHQKEIKLSFKGIFFCVPLFLIMMLPTLYILKTNPSVLSYNTSSKAHLFANLLNGAEMIKGFTYWLRYPSFYFGSTTLQLPKIPFDQRSFLGQVWYLLKWLIAISSVFLTLKANKDFFKKSSQPFLRKLCFITILSLIFVSAISPVPFNFWHLYLLYPFTLIPVAWFVSQWKYQKIFLTFCGIYFFSYSLISSYHSYKHEFKTNKTQDYKNKILKKRKSLIKRYQDFAIKFI